MSNKLKRLLQPLQLFLIVAFFFARIINGRGIAPSAFLVGTNPTRCQADDKEKDDKASSKNPQPSKIVAQTNISSASKEELRASIKSSDVRARLQKQLERLRERDRNAKVVKSEDVKVVFEDDYIVVVDKPARVLCVPTQQGPIPSLAQAVFERIEPSLSTYDRMVVHRLGMDTSGLVVFAKTMDALRGMNTLFRTRQVVRHYEVLVCGHVTTDDVNSEETHDGGWIDLPLMRDYEHPPFMRISTEDHQHALLDLDPDIVGRKLLEPPKACTTEFQVLSRESLLDANGSQLPVTRLGLTCHTGRTHQLNVHCAAFGHPIVADCIYGYGGDAAPNGGLSTKEVLSFRKRSFLSKLIPEREGSPDGASDEGTPDAAAIVESNLQDDYDLPKDEIDESPDDMTSSAISTSNTASEEQRDKTDDTIMASLKLQEEIANFVRKNDMSMCAHAKRIEFKHPITDEHLSFERNAPF